MKKISLIILLISIAWLPIQVAFASSFLSSMTTDTVMQAQVSIQQDASQNQKPPCHMQGQMQDADCCSQDSTCNQMESGCGQLVSFVGLAQQHQQSVAIPDTILEHFYNYPLVSFSSLSAYRPPRFI